MAALKWRDVKDLKTGAVRKWTAENLFRCDPYLVWADATTMRTPGDINQGPSVGVLVEILASDTVGDFLARMNPDTSDVLNVPFLPNGFEPAARTRFITGAVTSVCIGKLIDEVVQGRIERFTLQEPRPGTSSGDGVLSELEDALRIYFSQQYQQTPAKRSDAVELKDKPVPKTESGGGTYLGIIDDGLPFLRLREAIHFFDKPGHLWDQGWELAELAGRKDLQAPPASDDPHWKSSWDLGYSVFPLPSPLLIPELRGFIYGRRLKPFDEAGAAPNPDDRDEYCGCDYYYPSPRQTHGAGVLGLMAPWISGARKPVEFPTYISGLAMVQLPTCMVLDTGGGSLAMRVIDGLRYILWQEWRDREGGGQARPIVANVSYGVHAGPHDGTSMFESAVAEMLAANDNLHLVLPAGNSGRAGCHAQRRLAAKGTATMALQVLPDNSRDSFVEIWIPRDVKVELRIRPPGSDVEYEICEGQAKIGFDPAPGDPAEPQVVHFGAVYSREVAQGTKRGLILLAIGATRRISRRNAHKLHGKNKLRRREVDGAAGIWRLTFRNLSSHAADIDAWVERDDVAPDRASRSRQAFFPDSCDESVGRANASPENTLNGIATLKHKRAHVVGAMRVDGALSDYTAAGTQQAPGLRHGPDVVVPADSSRNLPGLLTIGFVSGAVGRINGTSAACAVYARALAKHLASDPNSLPRGRKPEDPTPEVTCAVDSQPEADRGLRGWSQRRLFSYDIDL